MKIERSRQRFCGQLAIGILIIIFIASCQASPPSLGTPVTIQRVVSGQTVEVTASGKQPAFLEPIRLAGISAPDLGQKPWGTEAREALKTWLGDRATVKLEIVGTDAYNRRLAYVWQDGKLLNEILVERGYALARGQDRSQYRDRLERAQDYARVMGYGIWNPAQPLRQTPDEFRKLKAPSPPRTAKPPQKPLQ
ncbi:thermonuclease family protein [Oscillatoria sp. FACHB-1406]|uniref:thermonuclease family protein n=1 Tax=Oscillatoria sp. FACHB-1406 TaxID=2692846 RepID=UPI0016887764|nr:thermonuclease family protein [Oscillatoria sp. FACHB-1406]MBD2576984.1 thermonuclease family protein [Oscillatoria sp. FACHB-1406]